MNINGKICLQENIRKISMDVFYELVTGDKYAFFKTINYLNEVALKKVVKKTKFHKKNSWRSTIVKELKNEHKADLIKTIFSYSFKDYLGWKEKNSD